jgi:hypothetical protein
VGGVGDVGDVGGVGTQAGGESNAGPLAGQSNGGQGGSGADDVCSAAAQAPVGTGLCGSPVEVLLTEGLIGLEASLDYDLSDANCSVVSGFDATQETKAAFVFRRSPVDEGGFNVSAVFPWSYTLRDRASSNDLPMNEVLVAALHHECGIELRLEFELSLDAQNRARVNVHDVRTP